MAGRKKSSQDRGIDSEFYELLQTVNSNISGVRDSVQSLDKKVELHIQETKFEFKAIQELDQQQNKILSEHHDRSLQLKRDNDLKAEELRKEMQSADQALSGRISSLEEPRRWLRSTWALLLMGGAGAAALVRIIALIGQITHK